MSGNLERIRLLSERLPSVLLSQVKHNTASE